MNVDLPPPEYDRPAFVRVIPARTMEEVLRLCQTAGQPMACTWRETIGGRPCVIVIPVVGFVAPRGTVTVEDRAAIIRHETGHCNGWPADHPPF